MANMSYCAMRNTKGDLMQCIEMMESGQVESKEEFNAMKSMIELCEEFSELAEGYNEDWLEEELEEDE